MDRRAIAQQRLLDQSISGHPFDSPEAVVTWLGAVQSQEYPYAKWGLAQRSEGVLDDRVEQALIDGTILRVHAMRPTWHFVPAADIRWLQDLTGPRVHAVNRSLYRNNELDEPILSRARDLMTHALRDSTFLTRQELAAVLARAGIEAAGQRLAYIIMHNELNAVLCSGSRRGKQFTYALVDERAPLARTLPREEALAELTRRYFTSHGPATVKDFVWWSGLTTADARLGLGMLGVAVERFEMEGIMFFDIPTGRLLTPDPPVVRLLQAYDEFVVAYTESRNVLKVDNLLGSMSVGRPLYYHPVVVDGQVAGHWRRFDSRSGTSVDVQLRRALSPGEVEALLAEVERFAVFAGMPVTLTGLD